MEKYKIRKNNNEYIVFDEIENYVIYKGTLVECTQYINNNIERTYNDDISFMNNVTEEL